MLNNKSAMGEYQKTYTHQPSSSSLKHMFEAARHLGAERKRYLKISCLSYLYYFSISYSNSFKLSSNRTGENGGTAFKLRQRMKNLSSCVLAFGHFTLLFCRGWQRNLPKFKSTCREIVFAH